MYTNALLEPYHTTIVGGMVGFFIECTNLNLNLCFVFQKYFVLRAKKGLITDGLFSLCRNPNYLGEMMIYGSFAGHPQ
jgi:steroid 5-alpha reductase family enzyme